MNLYIFISKDYYIMNKNNLTNEDYFSDEDNIQVDDNEMEPESDDSMDEETMKIIYQARNNQQSLDDMNFYDDIPKNKKQQKGGFHYKMNSKRKSLFTSFKKSKTSRSSKTNRTSKIN